MVDIEKRKIINKNNLKNGCYFTSILEEAKALGLLDDSDIENIQLQCIQLLVKKCEEYNSGFSSSIRVEIAENIMKSNLYTIGLYLKTLPDVDYALSGLKEEKISEMYQKGRKIIDTKYHTAKHFYKLTRNNRITTSNYTYNATLSEHGIGSFFKLYDPDYAAHESPASIDYQLCNPVFHLTGVEFIQKYLENLYLENMFCRNFSKEDIHHLLCGYDEGYKDLLINIFEHVLAGAIGCFLVSRRVRYLAVSKSEIQRLSLELSKYDHHRLSSEIGRAADEVLKELNNTSNHLRRYVERSLPKLTTNIRQGIKTNNLDKVFVSPVDPESRPKHEFLSGVKMDNEEYRKVINELSICRYSSDKIALIQQRIESFADLEDLLFDTYLSGEEVTAVFDILGDVELAAMVKRHPYKPGIQAVDLAENEETLRKYLQSYIDKLPLAKQRKIFELIDNLADDQEI